MDENKVFPNAVAAIREFFKSGIDGEPQNIDAKELMQLSPDDRKELAVLAAARLGGVIAPQ